MEEQINIYTQVMDSQLLLRKTLHEEQAMHPNVDHSSTRLLEIVDEQITLLGKSINQLKKSNE